MCLSSDSSQLWKLDGTNGTLRNKEDISISDRDHKWNVTIKKPTLFNIVNLNNDKVLEINNGRVTEEDAVDGKDGQLWRKGKPDADGYFSLEGSKSSKILTADKINLNLTIQGKENQLILRLFLKIALIFLGKEIQIILFELP